MRIFVASDIHGSEKYCLKMLDAYKAENCEKLILLGDILYHGPRNALPDGYNPKAVAVALNGVAPEILSVRGNCEAEVDSMVLDFPVMAEYALIFDEGRMLFLTHGHIFNESNPPKLKAGDVLINGHTHIPAVRSNGDYIYINPGSVSIPKEGSQRGYMIIENDSVFHKSLDGEIIGEYCLSQL